MKKFNYFIFLLVCAFIIIGVEPVLAQTAKTTTGTCGTSAAWNYDAKKQVLTVSGSGTVTKLKDFDTKNPIDTLVIKGGIDTIGESAFSKYEFFNIVLEEGIKRIERNAFYQCSKVSAVTIPKSVNYIGSCAFGDIESLSKATILGDVTADKLIFGMVSLPGVVEIAGKMENMAGMSASLEAKTPLIIFINNNPNYCIENGMILSSDEKIFYTINGGSDYDVVDLPNSVEKIMPYACYYLDVEKVKLSKNLKSIGHHAFTMGALKKIVLPPKVRTIGEAAFWGNSISTLKVNKNIKLVGKDAFAETEIKRVRFYNYPKMRQNAFDYDTEIEHYGEKKVSGSVIRANIKDSKTKYQITINKKVKRSTKYKITIRRGRKDIVKVINLSKKKRRAGISMKMKDKAEGEKHKVYVRIKTKGKWSKKVRIL